MDRLQDECAIELGFLSSEDEVEEDGGESEDLLPQEFNCHCCYQVLVDPTTLTCGHNFCRHCLALWLVSSCKKECPECRQIWRGFPKVNVSFRDLVEKRYGVLVENRRRRIMADPASSHALVVFQLSEQEVYWRPPPPVQWRPRLGTISFFSGVFIALSVVTVVFLVYHWSGGESKVELLVKKPLGSWTAEEVALWMENLGMWASPYRDTFQKKEVNGRLLNVLSEQDLLKPPYSIENPLHRRAILKEVQIVQELGFKRPQTLWEYKAVNEGKSLFFLAGLNDSPRLAILYMYFFDYHDSFLPLIHISCPSGTKKSEDELPFRNLQETPDWKQWVEFLVKLFLLPYALVADFAWDWLDIHYWTARFIILSAFLLTLQEVRVLRYLWNNPGITTLFTIVINHLLATIFGGIFMMIFWHLLPQFWWTCCFYWILFTNPVFKVFTLIQARNNR